MTENLPSGFETLPEPPRARHGKLLASVAAVIVLAGGGTATYLAFASSSNAGASSPKAAVQNVLDDLHNSDLLGVLDDLVPGERNALASPVRDDIASLKRLGVLSSSANGSAISGIGFTANNITYGSPVTINDHVQIVPITGGSVDLSSDVSKLPFTARILSSMTGAKSQTQHVPITSPVRVAAEKVDGRWYASLFYTIADQAAGHAVPNAAGAIPAEGAGSPQEAVTDMVKAAMAGDIRSVIKLVSPDELGALHDYGSLITHQLSFGPSNGTGVTLKTLDLNTTGIADGGVRVTISKAVLSKDGRDVTVTHTGDCYAITTGSMHKSFCAKDAVDAITGLVTRFGCLALGGMSSSYSYSEFGTTGATPGTAPATAPIDSFGSSPGCSMGGMHVTAAQKDAFTHLLTGLFSAGVDTAQSGGSWYVTPVRTLADESATVLDALQGDDLFVLAHLGR